MPKYTLDLVREIGLCQCLLEFSLFWQRPLCNKIEFLSIDQWCYFPSASSYANCFEKCRVIELIAAARCVVIFQQMDNDDEFDDVALDAVALAVILGGCKRSFS